MFESELSPLLSLLLRLDGARCSVGWSASRVYGTLRSTGLLAGYIIPCYDVLHTFSKEYMVEHPDVQHSRPNLDFEGQACRGERTDDKPRGEWSSLRLSRGANRWSSERRDQAGLGYPEREGGKPTVNRRSSECRAELTPPLRVSERRAKLA